REQMDGAGLQQLILQLRINRTAAANDQRRGDRSGVLTKAGMQRRLACSRKLIGQSPNTQCGRLQDFNLRKLIDAEATMLIPIPGRLAIIAHTRIGWRPEAAQGSGQPHTITIAKLISLVIDRDHQSTAGVYPPPAITNRMHLD